MSWQITTDIPAGNLIVDQIGGDVARIRQDQRGSTMPWFYWRFAVRGAQGRTVRFEFTDWDVIGTRGPCVSRDGGKSWSWLGLDTGSTRHFVFTFGPNDRDVQFCFCLPYLQADLDAFLANSAIRRSMLCRSRAGRDVEMLTVGAAGADRRVLLTARHHACESSASFVLEAMLQEIARAASGTPAAWLRQNVHVVAIPFVDKDGVEAGDQGKARDGHDHNRDYIAAPRYVETAAIMQLVRGGFVPEVSIDLHCPWIRGEHNEEIYQVGGPDPAQWKRQQELGRILERLPLPSGEVQCLGYRQSDDLPFGQAWNTSIASTEGCSCSKWMARNGAHLSTSLEIPYANVRAVTVTPQLLRDFGRRLAAAVGQYMQNHVPNQE